MFTPSIYVDYAKLLTLPFDFETKYEGGVELMIRERIALIAEVGFAKLNPEGAYSNGTYESTGLYYRIGAGYIGPFDAEHNIGISFRYASSMFDERGRVGLESPSGVQGDFIRQIDRPDLSAQWWEAVIYSDRRISKLFSFGVNIRLRILQSYDTFDEVDVYAIPGYGRAFDRVTPAANFFLKLSF